MASLPGKISHLSGTLAPRPGDVMVTGTPVADGGPGAPPPDSTVPVSDADPFSIAFFDDPHPVQQALRELGPIVWLRRYQVYASSRYHEVHAILNDWERFCSSRGVGLADFAKETPWRVPSLVLERDPPEHTRPRSVLSRVLSPATMKRLRASFQAQAEKTAAELVARGRFDAIRDLAKAYPLTVFPDALGIGKAGRENLLTFAAQSFNSFGPKNGTVARGDAQRGGGSGMGLGAVPAREPLAGRVRRDDQRGRRPRRDHARGGAASDPLAGERRGGHDDQRALVPPSTALRAFPSNGRGSAPTRRWRAEPSRRRCGSRARSRRSSARPRGG